MRCSSSFRSTRYEVLRSALRSLKLEPPPGLEALHWTIINYTVLRFVHLVRADAYVQELRTYLTTARANFIAVVNGHWDVRLRQRVRLLAVRIRGGCRREERMGRFGFRRHDRNLHARRSDQNCSCQVPVEPSPVAGLACVQMTFAILKSKLWRSKCYTKVDSHVCRTLRCNSTGPHVAAYSETERTRRAYKASACDETNYFKLAQKEYVGGLMTQHIRETHLK